MKRRLLTEAVKRAAEEAGYCFGMGRDAALAVNLPALPAVWLSPPELEKSSGRGEKHDVYDLKVRLLMARVLTAEGEADALERLEKDATVLCDAVRKTSGVRSVRNVEVVSGKKPVTVRGEVYVDLEFQVEIVYYAD